MLRYCKLKAGRAQAVQATAHGRSRLPRKLSIPFAPFLLAAFLAAPAWAQSTNQLFLTGTGSGNTPAISSTGVDSNINMALMPKGTGKVGIGTASPGAMIHDTGGIIIGPNAGSCTSTNNGEIRYTSGNTSPYNYCNGSAWIPLLNRVQRSCRIPTAGCHPTAIPQTPSGATGLIHLYRHPMRRAAGSAPLLAFTFNTSTHVWTLQKQRDDIYRR